MRKNFIQFGNDKLKDFGQATINLFIFLPYFFFSCGFIKNTFYAMEKPCRNKKIRRVLNGRILQPVCF